MKRKKLQCSVPTLMLAGVLCLTLAACGAKQSSDMPASDTESAVSPALPASDTDSAVSAALPVKAMNAKRVDENPYMAKGRTLVKKASYSIVKQNISLLCTLENPPKGKISLLAAEK